MTDFPKFQPIATAPIDEPVLLATTGDWVGEAVYGEDEENPSWRWIAENEPIHPNFKPLGWMPFPPAITEPA